MNGPEPVVSSSCFMGSSSATRLGIMKGTTTEGDRFQQRPEFLLEDDLEGPVVDDLVVLQGERKLLAHRIARRPALQRSHAILCLDRRAIVPFQPVAQR